MNHPVDLAVPTSLVGREIVKRDGSRAPFEAARIKNAITKAGKATGEYGDDEAALLTAQVLKVIIHRVWTSDDPVED